MKKVAVIGAGASGIIAIKSCLDEDLEPVCFERTTRIGGLWYYSEEVLEGQGSVAKSTVINTSKEMMTFSDFPIPKEFPSLMHNTKVLEYFHLFCKHFNLEKYIRFSTTVQSLTRASDYDETGRWEVETRYIPSGKVRTETYDAVILCSGHHAAKLMPQFEGQDKFKGKILHSSQYRSAVPYEDKRVVVVGIGNSGGDACVDLSKIASQVYLSTRRGAWVVTRLADNGHPTDMLLNNRSQDILRSILPMTIVNSLYERQLNWRFDHANYGLKPKHRFFAQHPTLNEDLPHRIASGRIIVKPDIRRLTERGVEFEDGVVAEDIDAIICATGYEIGFPFLEPGVIEVRTGNKVDMYKYAFPPDMKHPTLAVLGMIQPLGAINPIAELQARWATRVFKGLVDLPSKADMWRDIKRKEDDMTRRYVNTSRHTIQVDWITFMDDVATEFGCKPNLGRLMLTDPKLAWKCFFGPCTPYQYRLTGPGKWKGAREAILTQWERTLYPMKTRKVDRDDSSLGVMALIIVVIATLIWLLWQLLGPDPYWPNS